MSKKPGLFEDVHTAAQILSRWMIYSILVLAAWGVISGCLYALWLTASFFMLRVMG